MSLKKKVEEKKRNVEIKGSVSDLRAGSSSCRRQIYISIFVVMRTFN